VKKTDHRVFLLTMLLVLILIGVLQFFELPKLLDYILLVLAVTLGGIGLYKKLKQDNEHCSDLPPH